MRFNFLTVKKSQPKNRQNAVCHSFRGEAMGHSTDKGFTGVDK